MTLHGWAPVLLQLVLNPVAAAALPGSDTCVIEVEKVLDLRGDEVDLGHAAMSDDRIFLVRASTPYQIAVFDMSGRFLRTIGREGEGPGEFNTISAVVPRPDGGLTVFDARLLRMTRLDADYEVEGDHPVPPMIVGIGGAIRLEDGTYILTGKVLDRAAYGKPLAQVDSRGQLIRWYGRNETEKEGPLKGRMLPRRIAAHPAIGVVSIKNYFYVVERWADDGQLLSTWRRDDVPWLQWPPETEGSGHHLMGPPEDLFAAAGFDASGRLWTLAQTAPANEEWRDAWEDGRVVDRELWTDGMLEVVDLGEKEPLCSRRIPQAVLQGFPRADIFYTYGETDIGSPVLSFWRVSLRDALTRR